MAEVGSAYVSLIPSARGFGSKMQSSVGPQVDGVAKRSGSRFGKIFAYSTMGPLRALGGAALGFFAFNAIKNGISGVLEEAREAQVVTARTENVIKSMGLTSVVTAKQIAALSTKISNKTAVDDEAVQSAANLLLTFKGLATSAGQTGGAFEQATQLSIDMSRALGTDAKGSAIQLGKALNDPIKGISALSRVGVSFTEVQKEQIANFVESGNLAKAQAVILGEVKNQFGGAAAAMATPADRLKVTMANLKESIGTKLLPVVDRFINFIIAGVPRVSAAFASLGPVFGQVRAVIEPLVRTVLTGLVAFVTGSLVPAIANLYTAIQPALTEAFHTFSAAVSAAVAGLGFLGPALVAITGFLAAHKTAVTAIVIVVGTAVVAWKLWQGAILAWAAITKAAAAVQAAFNVVMAANPIGLVIIALVALAAGFVYAYKHSDKFREIVDKAFAVVKAAALGVANFFTTQIPAAFNKVVGAASSALGWVKSRWPAILAILTGPFGIAALLIVKNWDKIKAGGVEVLNFIQSLPGKIKSFFAGAATLLYSAGIDIIRGLINGIKSMAASAASAAVEVVKGALDKAKSFLGIHSPSRVWYEVGFNSMEGYRKAIADHGPRVLDQVKDLHDKLKTQLEAIKSDFASLSSSIASTFTGNLFEATTGKDFLANLFDTRGQLEGLKKAFKTLLGWGVDPKFLSQLFSSGNGALILDLAAGKRGQALDSAAVFADVQSLSGQLGGNVAQAQYGKKLDRANDRLDKIERAVKQVGRDVANALNHTAANAARSA